MTSSSALRIGWIGTGVMGSSMLNHILTKSSPGLYSVSVYSRTQSKCSSSLSLGAHFLSSPKLIAQSSDIIFTMVGFPSDVAEIYLGQDGIINNMKSGGIAVDFTTSDPSLAKKIYDEGKSKNINVIDAPVSGGDIGAKNGTLSIMCGGDENVIDKVRPLLSLFSSKITPCGFNGNGQHTKMVNQILICNNMIGVCEALLYAKNANLDLQKVLEAVSQGAAGSWSLSNLAPRIIDRNFDPGFYIEHFIKDLGICIAEARRMKLSLPGLGLAYNLYMSCMALGYEKLGTQGLMLAMENLNGEKGIIGGKKGEEMKKEKEEKEKEKENKTQEEDKVKK